MNVSQSIVRLFLAWIALLAAQMVAGMVIHVTRSADAERHALADGCRTPSSFWRLGAAAMRSDWRDWKLAAGAVRDPGGYRYSST